MAFAKHDVIGGAPVYEAVGPDETTATLDCVLHPYHFGGLGRLEALDLAMQAQTPLWLIKGDSVFLSSSGTDVNYCSAEARTSIDLEIRCFNEVRIAAHLDA